MTNPTTAQMVEELINVVDDWEHDNWLERRDAAEAALKQRIEELETIIWAQHFGWRVLKGEGQHGQPVWYWHAPYSLDLFDVDRTGPLPELSAALRERLRKERGEHGLS